MKTKRFDVSKLPCGNWTPINIIGEEYLFMFSEQEGNYHLKVYETKELALEAAAVYWGETPDKFNKIPDKFKHLPIYNWCDSQDEDEWICIGADDRLWHCLGSSSKLIG